MIPNTCNATGVQYEFQLRELWDGGIDPQAAFLASPDLYSTTTFATTLHYGPGETTLLEGKTYGWRVRALVGDGISETAVFRNNGFSEIFNFTYTGKCDVPKFILAKSEGTSSETISWQTDPSHIGYQVQYRKPGKSGAVWFEAETTGTTKTLIFLEPATTYEFRVGGQCMPDGGYSFSAVNTFTTPSREEASQYNCGIPPEILITNQDPLESLNPGDEFTAGDFPVKVVEASGGNGTFSGKGVIEVPYLALIKIAVVFSNININTDGQMTDGTVETDYDADFATGTNAGSFGNDKNKDRESEAEGDVATNEEDIPLEETDDEIKVTTDTDVASNSKEINESDIEVATEGNSDVAMAGGPNAGNDTNTAVDSGSANESGELSTDSEPEPESPDDAVDVAIEYNGQYYKNGDVIELAYDRNMEKQSFSLSNAPENSDISWSTHTDMIETSALSSAGDGQRTILDIRDYESRALEAEWRTEGKTGVESENVRVQINVVKKEFTLKELYASHKKNRVAKSGQKLYLINNTGITESSKFKDIAFSAVLDKKLKQSEISDNNLGWYYGRNPTVPNHEGDFNITRNIRLGDGHNETSVKAGYPNAIEKNINVEWVEPYDISTDLLSKIRKVLEFAQEFNKISSKFQDVLPCKASFFNDMDLLLKDGKVTFKIRTYNEEDKSSREIYDIFQTNIKLKSKDLASLECSKSLGFTSVSLGKIYGGIALGSTIDFKLSEKVKNETKEVKYVPEVSGGLVLTTSLGFKSNDIIDEYFSAKAALEIKAGAKTVYPYDGNENLAASYFYLGKTNFIVEGYLDTWLTGREEFNFKYLIYDSSWKSEMKLYFDFKEKDIYLRRE